MPCTQIDKKEEETWIQFLGRCLIEATKEMEELNMFDGVTVCVLTGNVMGPENENQEKFGLAFEGYGNDLTMWHEMPNSIEMSPACLRSQAESIRPVLKRVERVGGVDLPIDEFCSFIRNQKGRLALVDLGKTIKESYEKKRLRGRSDPVKQDSDIGLGI